MERKAHYCESVQFIRQKQNLNFVGAILLISLLVFVVFFPSLTNDFQRAWDDQWMVLTHPMITDQSMDNLWYYFTHYDRGQYFPLNQLYYIGIYNLFGFNASAFHAGSLILHLVNVILVFLFLHQLVKLTNRRTGSPSTILYISIITIIFALHPLQVESVAWISASKVLLYTTFTLGSLLCYLKYKTSHRYGYLVLTFLGYCLSLMAKEQAVILPLNMVLIDFILHTYRVQSFSKMVWLEKIPFFLVAFLFWYWSTQNNLGVLHPEWAYTWDQRLVFGSYSLIVYVVRFLLPTKLLFYYGYPILAGEELSWTYYGYIIVALFLMMYMIDLYRSKKYLPFFGLSFFVINILLVLHILPMPRSMITADRYMYLSIVGLATWAIWGVNHLYQWAIDRNWSKEKSSWRYVFWGFVGLYLIGCGLYSNNLTRKWNDSMTIKQELRDYLETDVTEQNDNQ